MSAWTRNRIDHAFYKWNPDKKQETGKEKVVAVGEEHKTQVAVNNHGKTNEATKNVERASQNGTDTAYCRAEAKAGREETEEVPWT